MAKTDKDAPAAETSAQDAPKAPASASTETPQTPVAVSEVVSDQVIDVQAPEAEKGAEEAPVSDTPPVTNQIHETQQVMAYGTLYSGVEQAANALMITVEALQARLASEDPEYAAVHWYE